jgi:glycerol-3-phosphate dehydrogenase
MTGAGVLRDLALRGIRAVLVERGDLTSGTTGRYHGLLHSGGRYVIKDPVSARDCARENSVLRRILPQCIEDTGGYFVVTPWDPPDYADKFVAGCREQGVPCEEVPVREALRQEPRLNPRITRAFAVPDAAADSFLSVGANVASAREYGGAALTYHRVQSLLREGDMIRGALLEDRRTGETVRIEAAIVINAAGAWAGQIGAMAGVPITIVPGKGVMVAMNHRLVNTVINRCKPPADGDILVPIRTVCVIGTTDQHVEDPDDLTMPADEIAFMLEEGDKLVPGLAQSRALRAWSGVRPLYKDADVASDRDLSRDFKLLDHRERDGRDGFISIVGGKYTTYRLMAERTVDLAAQRLGVDAPCRTRLEPAAAPPAAAIAATGTTTPLFWMGQPLARVEEDQSYGQLLCECELVTCDRLKMAIADGAANLDDVRRTVRLGMGPCQGGFCIYRAAALLYETHEQQDAAHADVAATNAALRDFLEERWRGLTPVLWGDQLRQERLDELIFLGVLGVHRLPAQPPAPAWLVPVTTGEAETPLGE